MTKSTKSHQRERSPLFENSSRVHELVALAMRGKRVLQRTERKSAVLPLPAIAYYHACEHITRESRADSCTHCLHARIIGLAGVGLMCALTEVTISLLQREKVARFTAADEVLPCVYCQKNLFRYVRTQTRTKSERPCLGDADTHAPRMCQFPTGEG